MNIFNDKSEAPSQGISCLLSEAGESPVWAHIKRPCLKNKTKTVEASEKHLKQRVMFSRACWHWALGSYGSNAFVIGLSYLTGFIEGIWKDSVSCWALLLDDFPYSLRGGKGGSYLYPHQLL